VFICLTKKKGTNGVCFTIETHPTNLYPRKPGDYSQKRELLIMSNYTKRTISSIGISYFDFFCDIFGVIPATKDIARLFS